MCREALLLLPPRRLPLQRLHVQPPLRGGLALGGALLCFVLFCFLGEQQNENKKGGSRRE